jgi:hypothetical protein
MSSNNVLQMGMLPPLMNPDDVWKKVADEEAKRFVYYNVLTREKVHQHAVKSYTWDAVLKVTVTDRLLCSALLFLYVITDASGSDTACTTCADTSAGTDAGTDAGASAVTSADTIAGSY